MNRGKTERLLNLVFALMSTTRAMDRDEIRRSVSGYEKCASDESFERMFERDKDELRSLGLPVETVTNAFDEVLGYRISTDRYEFFDLDLTARDLELLGIATKVWDEAVLSNAAQTAKWKIESNAGNIIAESELVGVARVRADSAAILPLITAARERKVVTFTYQAFGQEPEKRVFEPWSVICRSGRWYTVGYDQIRSERRIFNLARIIGQVTLTAKTFQAEAPDTRFTDIQLPDNDLSMTSTIKLTKQGGAALRRRAHSIEEHSDFDIVEVTAPREKLISLTLGAVTEVIAVEPQDLRHEIVDRLNEILAGYRD